jgi:hypothetical protein
LRLNVAGNAIIFVKGNNSFVRVLAMDKEALLAKLKELLDSKSVIEKFGPMSDSGQEWLANVKAHLELIDQSLAKQFGHLMYYVVMPLSAYTLGPIWTNMQSILRTAIARLELETPRPQSKVYGSGDAYDVYRDLGTIIASAKQAVFVVDPYADEEVFELYLEKIGKGIAIRLLSRPPSSPLKRVAAKFASRPGIQFEGKSTNEVHDRVIFLDSTDCWVLGQSIKDAASKKPTYLLPVDAVTDMLKLYETAWQKATPY